MSSHTTQTYYSGCNQHLLAAVPASARTIIEVGCGNAALGLALKKQRTDRTVIGLEIVPEAAQQAAAVIDRAIVIDIEKEVPDIEPHSIDCIIFGDVLEHLINPGAVLRRYKQLVKPDGMVLCSIPNLQHFSAITQILMGNFQYADNGLLDHSHLRFFTYATALKLFLDAGYEPSIIECVEAPAPQSWINAILPLTQGLGVDTARTAKYLNTYQMIVAGRSSSRASLSSDHANEAVTIVTCVTDDIAYQTNLRASPCLQNSIHEIITGAATAGIAATYNKGIASAKNDLVVCVRQDIYLPAGWIDAAVSQYRLIEATHGPIGIAGIYGVVDVDGLVQRAGKIVERDSFFSEPAVLPVRAQSLDDVLFILPRNTPLWFDPTLGNHLFGADISLTAQKAGLSVWILDLLCILNTKAGDALPAPFVQSAQTFAAKWKTRLPIATAYAAIESSGEVHQW